MKRFEIFFGIVKIPADFIMSVAAFVVAYELRLLTEPITGLAKPIDYTILPSLKEYMDFSIGAATALIVIFAVGKMYSLKSTVKFSREIGGTLLLGSVWLMAIISYFFFMRTFPFSRLAIFYSWGLALIFIIFGRALIKLIQISCLKLGIGKRNLLFIGNNNITEEIIEKLIKDPYYKIIGIIGNKENEHEDVKILGNISQMEYLAKKHKAEEIIQTESSFSETQNEDILEFCDLNHISYRFIPDLLDVRRSNIFVETIGAIPIISLKPTPLDGWGKVTKRITDIFGATIGMIILSPILLATAVAIKLDSKGSILFTRLDDGSPVKRVGQYGKQFKFYKFRSMHPNTDRLRYTELAEQNLRTDGPLIKIDNDPRITRVGKFIRKYSIDELPQLWNVFIGNLSLVGPRPHLPEEVAHYEKHHHFVFNIKPGITGLAQISGRSDISFEKEAKLDRYYIENWSTWMDIKIIIKTLFVVLKGYRE